MLNPDQLKGGCYILATGMVGIAASFLVGIATKNPWWGVATLAILATHFMIVLMAGQK